MSQRSWRELSTTAWKRIRRIGFVRLTICRLRSKHFPIPPALSFQRLTFRRGTIQSARFGPDGHTIVYSAAWEGYPPEIYGALAGSSEARPLGFPDAKILSVSKHGDMALLLHVGPEAWTGTLARAALSGGASREILENVWGADWSPDRNDLAVIRVVGNRSRLEFPIGKVLYEGEIQKPRICPRENLIAFLEREPDFPSTLVVVDLEGKMRMRSHGLGHIISFAWSPKGDELWCSSSKSLIEGNHELIAVSLSGKQRIIQHMTARMQLEDISTNGSVLMSLGNTRTAVNGMLSGQVSERDLSWLDWSICADLSPDGRNLLLWEVGEGSGGHV